MLQNVTKGLGQILWQWKWTRVWKLEVSVVSTVHVNWNQKQEK